MCICRRISSFVTGLLSEHSITGPSTNTLSSLQKSWSIKGSPTFSVISPVTGYFITPFKIFFSMCVRSSSFLLRYTGIPGLIDCVRGAFSVTCPFKEVPTSLEGTVRITSSCPSFETGITKISCSVSNLPFTTEVRGCERQTISNVIE